jgi:hypothetical protein
MLKKISTLLLATVFAFSMMTCKSKADLTSAPKQTLEDKSDLTKAPKQTFIEKADLTNANQQTFETKAVELAIECIKKLEKFNDDTYKECVSGALLQAYDETNDPKDKEKFNNVIEFKKTISEVDTRVKAMLLALSAPEDQGKTSPYNGYGNPNVKQVLSEDGKKFLIKEYATDETYGYTETNPIMVGGARNNEGPQNEQRFFNSLAGPLRFPVIYKRLYSCCPFYTKNGSIGSDGIGRGRLDVYELSHDSLNEPVKLYINMYDSDVLKVPVGGFTIKK